MIHERLLVLIMNRTVQARMRVGSNLRDEGHVVGIVSRVHPKRVELERVRKRAIHVCRACHAWLQLHVVGGHESWAEEEERVSCIPSDKESVAECTVERSGILLKNFANKFIFSKYSTNILIFLIFTNYVFMIDAFMINGLSWQKYNDAFSNDTKIRK